MYRNLDWVKNKIESSDFLKKHEKPKMFKKYVEECDINLLQKQEFNFEFDCEKIHSAQRPRKGRSGIYAPDKKYKDEITKTIKSIIESEYKDFEIPRYTKIRVEITASFRQVVKNKFEKILIMLDFMNVFKKPDVDNIAKIHLDACNGLLWEDDAHITELLVIKRYNKENEDQNNMKIKVIYN